MLPESALPIGEAADRSRTLPSEHRPQSIGHKARPAWCRIPNGPNCRHRQELTDFLAAYACTVHEKSVFNRYFEFSRSPGKYVEHVDVAARECGLSTDEFICRETLKELKKFVAAKGYEIEGATVRESFPPLDQSDVLILMRLDKEYPRLLVVEDFKSPSARNSIIESLAYLRQNGLVDRPKGERKGNGLTDLGLRLAAALRAVGPV